MYNLYQFEKDAQEEERQMNHAKSMKLLRNHRLEERTKMAEKYKKRVTDFMSILKKAPIMPPDEFVAKNKLEEYKDFKSRFVGTEFMVYSNRTDFDRVKHFKSFNESVIDSVPPDEVGLKLRPREKSKEIVDLPFYRKPTEKNLRKSKILDKINKSPLHHSKIKTFSNVKNSYSGINKNKVHLKAARTIFFNYKS